jgi:hypothetical protein
VDAMKRRARRARDRLAEKREVKASSLQQCRSTK